jgi:hypothetical protein
MELRIYLKHFNISNKTGPFNKAAVRTQNSARAAVPKTMHGVSSSLRDTQETNRLTALHNLELEVTVRRRYAHCTATW